MNSDEELAGNAISWSDDRISSYTTNFGQVEVSKKNPTKVIGACVGFGREQGNLSIAIKIVSGEFIIYQDHIGSRIVEYISSPNYPYQRGTVKLPIITVIDVLKNDQNDSIAGILTKKEIVKLMRKKLKFTREDNIALKELYASWRTPIRR